MYWEIHMSMYDLWIAFTVHIIFFNTFCSRYKEFYLSVLYIHVIDEKLQLLKEACCICRAFLKLKGRTRG